MLRARRSLPAAAAAAQRPPPNNCLCAELPSPVQSSQPVPGQAQGAEYGLPAHQVRGEQLGGWGPAVRQACSGAALDRFWQHPPGVVNAREWLPRRAAAPFPSAAVPPRCLPSPA